MIVNWCYNNDTISQRTVPVHSLFIETVKHKYMYKSIITDYGDYCMYIPNHNSASEMFVNLNIK